jgi:hypothetical protein
MSFNSPKEPTMFHAFFFTFFLGRQMKKLHGKDMYCALNIADSVPQH